jgi:hypothetical protein
LPGGTAASTDPALPAAISVLHARSGGKTIVLRTAQHDAWPELPGLLAQAEREGVAACAEGVGWEFMVTSQFISRPGQVASAAVYTIWLPGPFSPGTSVVVRLRRAVVTIASQ